MISPAMEQTGAGEAERGETPGPRRFARRARG